MDTFNLGRWGLILAYVAQSVPPPDDIVRPSYLRSMLARILALLLLIVCAFVPLFAGDEANKTAGFRPVLTPGKDLIIQSQPSDWLPTPTQLRWSPDAPPAALRLLGRFENRFGNTPQSHRVLGLLIHGANAILLWFVLRRFSVPAAWLASALFALHPGAVRAVASFDQHGRIWGAFFGLLALLCFFRLVGTTAGRRLSSSVDRAWENEYRTSASRWLERILWMATIVIAICFAWIAALCQPTVGMILLPIILLFLTLHAPGTSRSLYKNLALVSPLLVLTGAAAAGGFLPARTSSHVIGVIDAMHTLPEWLRAVWAGGWTIRWVTLPLPATGAGELAETMIARASGGSTAAAGPLVLTLGVAGWIAVIGCCIRSPAFRGDRVASIAPKSRFAILAVIAALLLFTFPVPTIRTNSESPAWMMGDGETYLAAIPLVIIASGVIWHWTRGGRPLFAEAIHQLASVSGISLLLIVLFGALTFTRASYATSPSRMLQAAVDANPSSSLARARLAQYFLSQKDSESALNALGNISTAECTDSTTAVTEGDLLRATGRPGAAVVWYELAVKLDPTNADVPARLAAVDSDLGRSADARAAFEQGVTSFPRNADLRNDYGVWLASRHELEESAVQLLAAINADPDFVPAHINYASVLVDQQKLTEAAEQLQIAVSLDPSNSVAYHNAGAVLAALHDYDDAVRMLTVAVVLNPDSAETHNDLGVALASAGKYRRATFEFERALSLKPDYVSAERNLSVTKARAANQPTTQRTNDR